jgi:hypothetical protein
MIVLLQRMSQVLARTGHGPMSDLSPLSGEERKSNFGAVRSVNDPSSCAAASMRYHDEIRVFSRLMAKSVVGNNQ